ncbi:tRNA preQ1(34) S-adenosylmethionine ribosyltransferase-isomerase QueA [Prochlorococcus sp. AH-716-N14]|nr:tRNA preQ1(34) S-adenosylmethionine ribosyltransferase-isomerase QueA [Prochlorococcus sp. AH-716-N14]
MNFEIHNEEIDHKLEAYDYILDETLIANKPSKVRHESRLMIVRDSSLEEDFTTNKYTKNLLDELRKGDLVVVNDTKVMKARLKVELENGRLVELLVLEKADESTWLCLARPAKKLKINSQLNLKSSLAKDIKLHISGIDKETGGRFIKFPENINDLISMNNLLDIYGEIPLPPYIKSTEEESFHKNSYQTEYASNPGAVAAPTAGLHLSKSLISNLKKKGILVMPITLHVGYGTFKPIDQEDLSNLKLHKEWVSVSRKVVEEIKRVKKTDRRVIAIGTTSVRALESCYSNEMEDLIPIAKYVDLVIKPGYKFKAVDGLLTNFHLPKSSLLLLVSAMIGRERLLNLYKNAIREKFRFFSYGDAMYISPDSFLEKNKFKL